jgi:hypothetical protein
MFAIYYRCGYIHIGNITKPDHRRKIDAAWKLIPAGELESAGFSGYGPDELPNHLASSESGPRKLGQR